MNPQLNCIFSRRSVRSYIKNKPIPKKVINDILEAAMAAPSAVNKRSYEFIVIDDINLLKKASECLPHGKFLAEASLGLIVCGNIKQAHNESIGYLLQDCSAAIENILIAVSILGFGACWLGIYPEEERIQDIRTIFSLPADIIPISAIPIGYPGQQVPALRTQYDPKKIHKNSW